jgi:hypothetical protein
MLEERIRDLWPSVEETDALLLETDKTTGISTQKHQVTQVVVTYRPRAYCLGAEPVPAWRFHRQH